MIKIEPNVFYPLAELDKMFSGHIGLDTLLDRLNLRRCRVFRSGVWGSELLIAVEQATPFVELNEQGASASVLHVQPGAGRGRKARAATDPVRKLSVRDLAD